MRNKEYIQVNCQSFTLDRIINERYHGSCCIGEIIRNCCVNLGFFDVDTVEGITKNAIVLRKINEEKESLWQYNPNESLRSVVTEGDILKLHIGPSDQ